MQDIHIVNGRQAKKSAAEASATQSYEALKTTQTKQV